MPLFSTLTEDWSTGTIDRTVKWPNTFDPAGNPAANVVGGRARVYTTAGPVYAGIESAANYTLQSSQIHVEVPTTAAVTSGSTGTVVTAMIVRSSALDPGTRLTFQRRADLGTLTFESQTGYFEATPTSVTYSATTHRWWRMRASTTQVFFETSSDTAAWTVQRTLAAPAWIANADLRVTLEAWRDNGTQDYAEFDNINVTPVAEEPGTTTAAGSFAAFFGM